MVNKNSAHIFALYAPGALTKKAITDAALIHRITKILRLYADEKLIIFDDQEYAETKLAEISPKKITLSFSRKKKIASPSPRIALMLSVIQKSAFEDAVVRATIMGVENIIPIITDKTHASWLGKKDDARLKNLMIAAAEQSKQFALPTIEKAVPFAQALAASTGQVVLFFDPNGSSAFDVAAALHHEKIDEILCIVGPEGDLSDEEKEFLKTGGALFCALTPAILRTEDAVMVGLGMLRSLLNV